MTHQNAMVKELAVVQDGVKAIATVLMMISVMETVVKLILQPKKNASMIILQLTPLEITVTYMTAILTGAEGMIPPISTLSSNAASAKKISPHIKLRNGTRPMAPTTGTRMSSTTPSRVNA